GIATVTKQPERSGRSRPARNERGESRREGLFSFSDFSPPAWVLWSFTWISTNSSPYNTSDTSIPHSLAHYKSSTLSPPQSPAQADAETSANALPPNPTNAASSDPFPGEPPH